MIAHFSIPARDPQATAELFARIIDGVAIRFPVVDGGWMALARDGSGTGVEVVPETTAIQFEGEDGAPPRYQAGLRAPPTEATAIHFALTTRLSQDEVMAMGLEKGWRTTHQSRGPFDLVEMWIDNRIMVEVLPPESTARYLAFATPEAAAAGFAAEFA